MIVATPKGKLEIITNLVGRHNVYNVLAAVAVGLLLGLELADIGAGVEAVQVIPGRCEVVNNVLDLPIEGEDAEGLQQQQPNLPRDFPVVVDAADTPQRLAAVLDALREAGAERIFTVFGCDGVVSGKLCKSSKACACNCWCCVFTVFGCHGVVSGNLCVTLHTCMLRDFFELHPWCFDLLVATECQVTQFVTAALNSLSTSAKQAHAPRVTAVAPMLCTTLQVCMQRSRINRFAVCQLAHGDTCKHSWHPVTVFACCCLSANTTFLHAQHHW
jgi:hypothetical protein